MNSKDCLKFPAERVDHQSSSCEFHIQEIGRTFKHHPVDIETWSKKSGQPIPEKCQIPFVRPPSSLPLSLKMDTWVEDDNQYYSDETNHHGNDFNIKIPPVDMPEFLPDVFAIEKCLTWALREKVSLSQVEFFAIGLALRNFAMAAYEPKSTRWAISLLHYKGKIFMAGFMKMELKYWLEGFHEPDSDHGKIINDISSRMHKKLGCFPHIALKAAVMKDKELMKHGKKFEDVMKSGGPGNPLYRGEDTDIRCIKLATLESHTILTTTRISCQSPDGPIDEQENYVEIKTMVPMKGETFARYKSCKLWIHCALLGVDTVYCGVRTLEGMLIDVRKYSIDELAAIGKNYWTPNDILTFLDNFLSWLKEKLNKNAVRNKRGEEWIKSKLDSEEASMFNLICMGDGFIRLTPGNNREFKKAITEKYEHVIKLKDDSIDRGGLEVCDDNVPDTWDDSD